MESKSRLSPERIPLLGSSDTDEQDVTEASRTNNAEITYALKDVTATESTPTQHDVTESSDMTHWKGPQLGNLQSKHEIHCSPNIFTHELTLGSHTLLNLTVATSGASHCAYLAFSGALTNTLLQPVSPQDYPESLARYILEWALKSHGILSVMGTEYSSKSLMGRNPTLWMS